MPPAERRAADRGAAAAAEGGGRRAVERAAGLAGLLAPTVFVGAWAAAGAARRGYDPVQEAISQLAREGAPHRWAMTAGFAGFGLLLPVFATRLPRLLGAGRPLAASMLTAGVSTLAVAALPLQRDAGGPGDLAHAAAAGVGYVAMAASPLLGAAGLRRQGRRTAAAVSTGVGLASVAALVASVTTGPTGLWQRIGLGVVDAWFAGWALTSLRRGRRGRCGR